MDTDNMKEHDVMSTSLLSDKLMTNEKEEKEHDVMNTFLPSDELMTNEKEENVPGQQIGLYSEADNKEVGQVVDILNPDKNSMESRG